MATQKKAASSPKAPAKKAPAKKATPAKKAAAPKKAAAKKPAEFKADAKDGDGDGLVQDGTVHERKVIVDPGLEAPVPASAPAPEKRSLLKRLFKRG